MRLVMHFLLSGASEKRRREVEHHLAESEEAWRDLAHPSWAMVTPVGQAPAWWDEEQAGREALAYMGTAGQRELARLTGQEAPAR